MRFFLGFLSRLRKRKKLDSSEKYFSGLKGIFCKNFDIFDNFSKHLRLYFYGTSKTQNPGIQAICHYLDSYILI